MKTDAELMAAYIRGDQGAFKALFGRHAPAISALVRRRVRGADVNDLVQQTFLNLHRARLDFRAGDALRPWLNTIAMNCVREHYRRAARRPELPLEIETSIAAPDLAQIEEQRITRARMRRGVEALPALQRTVIELHWFEELPFAEIAKKLGASVSAVKVRAHRGYERLREAYASDYDPSLSRNS